MSTVSRVYADGVPRARPWLDAYPSKVPASLQYPDRPIHWLLWRAAQRAGDRTAIHYLRERLSYTQLHRRACRAATFFHRLGVRGGDRVGILLPNTPEFMEAAYGAWMMGAVVVPLNPLVSPREIARVLAASECRTVVSLDLLVPLLREVPCTGKHQLLRASLAPRLRVWQRVLYRVACWQRNRRAAVRWPTEYLWPREVNGCAPWPAAAQQGPDDLAVLLPTGGTTGSSKLVALSHGNLLANAWQLNAWTGCSFGEDSVLAVVPFFHSYGLSTCLTAGVASAATIVLYHRFQPRVVSRLLQQHRPACFPAVPMMVHALNQQWKRRPPEQAVLDVCVSGGAPLDAEDARAFAEHSGGRVVEGYGLSEASPVTHVGPLDGTARAGTIGIPLPDTDAMVVDPCEPHRELATGEVGELCVRGPQVMSGYYHDAQETRRVLRDGWLRTGDLARREPDGHFVLIDRLKDVIITSGENVYPSEVERVLRQMPGVQDVAVVGVADRARGQAVKAFVQCQRGVRFSHRAWNAFIEDRLGVCQRPRHVELVAELPTSFLGKVVRRSLRE